MELAWILGGLFTFVTLAFIGIAFLLPEFVGITGKRAKELIGEHQDNATEGKEVAAEMKVNDDSKEKH